MFNKYYSVDKACKKVLFTIIPEAYLRSFKNKYTGYANVKCLDILSHLWTTYGVLQDFEVQENDVRMKQPITAETLFEEFVEQIETAVDAVATQVPYTRQQIVSIAFTTVENSGIYYDGVKEWRQKDTADKTWEAFKTFFAREFREIRVQPRTSSSEGYGTNIMRGGHTNAAERDEMQQQQAEALANLSTAKAADRQAVTAMSRSNATITQELRTATATATIATLQQPLASCACATTPRTGAKEQQRRQASQQRPHNPGRNFTPLDPDGYRWLHGYHINKVHNGASCYNTLPGNHRAATRADPMGGITNNKPE